MKREQLPEISIGQRRVGPAHPTYIVAELSANHQQDLGLARDLVHIARDVGADAVKLQTYTPDTMTLRSDQPWFRIGPGTIWEGRQLHDLYSEASTPWEWHEPLKELAEAEGLDFFSTPFDSSAVAFLRALDVPAYKIASFELLDLALIREVSSTGKPVIISTGMASFDEIDEAVAAARDAGAGGVALLRCNSSYPAPSEEMDLSTIPDMIRTWQLPVGLSDHTLETNAAIVAVGLGASLLEKHLAFSREDPGPDSAFSLEPEEFRAVVDAVREAERVRGSVRYGPSPSEMASLAFRRSLFVVEAVRAGEAFTTANVRAIRPGDGLPPKHLDAVIGRKAPRDIEPGTPLSWELLGGELTPSGR
ncbi:MAG: pseudaminic acid synthase [Actinobacteria bacterium]|nr:pseudaminic acid synthase [Actinomycetota bacterium]